MPCAVAAVAKSPVFTPSPRASPIFCKTTTLFSPSPSSPSPSRSPFSPLTLRLPKQPQQPSNFNREFMLGEPLCSTSSRSNTETTLLKRKRPLRLDVPVTALSFESMVQTRRETDRLDDDVEVEGESYSVYCKRGKRGSMEDRFSAHVSLHGDSKQAFFGVFDGHGGAKAAEYAAKNMDRHIMNEVEKRREERIEEGVKEGYLTTDAEFLKEETNGGTCCVTALIRKGNLVVSNAGDCRAVMSRGGVAEALTVDHRPSREDEKERVQSNGGYVDFCRGVWRIQGSLAVSRGIGDHHLKQWVIPEPETQILRIEAECEFLILASDGLWDKVSNQEAVDIIRPLCIGIDNLDALSACKKLVDLSLRRGSSDDISIMVIQLGQFIQ